MRLWKRGFNADLYIVSRQNIFCNYFFLYLARREASRAAGVGIPGVFLQGLEPMERAISDGEGRQMVIKGRL